MSWELLWEAVKEPLRELVLAVIPVAANYFGSLDAKWAVALYLVLRLVDSWLHEYGTAEDKPQLVTGITRF